MTYWLLGAGEAFLIPLLLAKEGSSGFQAGLMKIGAVMLTPFVLWRVVVLYGRPEWLSVGETVMEKKKQ